MGGLIIDADRPGAFVREQRNSSRSDQGRRWPFPSGWENQPAKVSQTGYGRALDFKKHGIESHGYKNRQRGPQAQTCKLVRRPTK